MATEGKPKSAEAILEKSLTNPLWWTETFLGENLWNKQKEILESIRDHSRTAVRTCHGIGKTRVASDAALWFLCTHENSVVITTAPTWRQVEELLWREIRQRHARAKIPLGGTVYKTPQMEISEKWFAMGVSTKEPERFQGFHAEWMLVIVDESSGVDDAIFEAIRGIMASGNVRLLLLGNPTKPQGEFYDAFNSKRHLYNTIAVSAFDTPNLAPIAESYARCKNRAERLSLLRAAPIVRPYLVNPAWVADMIEEFGEDSPIYKVRVLGQFPPDAPDQLIPLHWIEEAQNRWEDAVKWWELTGVERQKLGLPSVEFGVDVARYGDAETIICARSGDIVAPLFARSKQDTMTTAGWVIHEAQGQGAEKVNIDVVGIGAGVYDRCKELKLKGVNEVNVGEKARDPEKFSNLRAEAYWNLRQRFEREEIMLPPDQKLTGQLSAIKVKYSSKGQVQIESKDDMRKRNVASPDRADALCLSFLPGGKSSSRFGAVGSYNFNWRNK